MAKDLAEWRLACGRPAGRELVFPRADGGPWRDHDWRNWRRRFYQPVARAVGLESPRPYDLRGSFASLLIQETRRPTSSPAVPRQARAAGWSEETLAATVEQALGCEPHRTPAQRRETFREHLDRLAAEALVGRRAA